MCYVDFNRALKINDFSRFNRLGFVGLIRVNAMKMHTPIIGSRRHLDEPCHLRPGNRMVTGFPETLHNWLA